MSIESEISRISGNIEAAYSAADTMGADLPQTRNSANLANAIGSIPQSGSVDAYTKAETNALLSAKAPAINTETALSYDTDLSDLSKTAVSDLTVKVQQGTLGHPYLLLSEGASLLPDITSATQIGTVNGVTIEIVNGSSVRLNGTATGSVNIWLKSGNVDSLPMRVAIAQGDTVTVGAMVKGTNSGGSTRIIHRVEDGLNTQNSKYYSGEGIFTAAIQARGACSTAKVCVAITSGCSYTDYVITPFMFAGTDVTTVQDPLFTDEWCDISDAVDAYDYLSTFPNQHKVLYIADTKTYIDNKEIDPASIGQIVDQKFTEKTPEFNNTINTNVNTAVDAKMTYLTPEQYGAIGDGVADDTTALQCCLTHASSSNKIMALKRYKITSQLMITGNNIDVEINSIIYTGADFAVKIASRWSKVGIKQIVAESGSGVLIKDFNTAASVEANSYEFNYILSYGDCIRFEAEESWHIAYNNLKVPYLKSENAHLIDVNDSCTETVFHGGKTICHNGWCVYKTLSTNTFMHFTFEDVKDICHGHAKLINCRVVEGLNYYPYEWKQRQGCLYKLTRVGEFHGRYMTDENVLATFTSVDVSEVPSFAESMAAISDKLDELPQDDPQRYYNACYDVIEYAPSIIAYIARYDASGDHKNLDGSMVIYWNKKAYIPNHEVVEDITVTPFVPLTTVVNNPTYFRIGTANCVINLNDSYCPVGINKFIVEQTNDYKASIYNKDGTLIFDGANRAAGIYEVSCGITPLSGNVFDGVDMPLARKESYAARIRYIYTGSNEAWTVREI